MCIHFYTHYILIFVWNYDKNSLNINVPYVIGPSLNAFNWIFLPTPFCNFFEFPTTIRTHQKFNNIVHILGLKITKSTLWNQTWWGLPNNTKNAPNFQYSIQSWFFQKIQWKNDSIFNRFHTVALNNLNQVVAPLFIEIVLMISSIYNIT